MIIKDLLKTIIPKSLQVSIKNKMNKRNKLIMCLFVKNEEDIIEPFLVFHKNMGVDGFIVTDNNSTDNTRKILDKYKEKGYIYEIIDEKCITLYQDIFCDKMIKIAKKNIKQRGVLVQMLMNFGILRN